MKFELDQWVVPHVMRAQEYGLELCELTVKDPSLARMCLNENPLQASPKVVAALTRSGVEANRYPDMRMALRTRIGKMHGFGPENVFLGNGSSENIDSMMRAFLMPGDEVLLPEPTFSLFNVRASVAGAEVVKVQFTEGDLDYNPQHYLDAITNRTKLIVVVTPNNPTGAFFPNDAFEALLERGIPTCIDQAYLEFHPEVPSKADLIRRYPNAFVSHTLSKAYGLAGIRFGYLVGAPEMVSIFERLSLPWNISFATLYAVEAALDDDATLERNLAYNTRWLNRYAEVLRELNCRPIHPAGNFMMADASAHGRTTKQIYADALEHGVILKTVGPLHGKDGYFRLTPGTEEENERAVAFFRGYFK